MVVKIKSMTGYGRAEFQLGADVCAIEVRSLNGRYLEINVRGPERFAPFELKLRDELKVRFARGSFTVNIAIISAGAQSYVLNKELARLYIDAGRELKYTLGIDGGVDAGFLLKLKDIFVYDKKDAVADADWESLRKGLNAAFDGVEKWRIKEGESIAADMTARLASLEATVRLIEAGAGAMVEAYARKMREGIERLLKDKTDEGRILIEAAVYAERCDVSEETNRLRSHIALFREYLGASDPAGKRLDFLCQEIGREINTVGSKSPDAAITQTVVEMKNVLEKLREQAQNVE